MKKAVIYARVSSTVERNRQNTERQVMDLNAYAEYANLEVVEVFEEYINLSICKLLYINYLPIKR